MNYEEADDIVKLPCNDKHIFHYDCLDAWIGSVQNKNEEPRCPLCRKEIDLN